MIFSKILLFNLITIFLVISCKKPLIKNFTVHPDPPIITSNLNYTRNGLQAFTITDSLKVVANEDLIGLPFSSYLQYSGELIFTTHNGYLYFVSLNDFDDIRKTNLADGISTAPSIFGKILFLAVSKGEKGLVAYNMNTGKIQWDIPGMLSQSSPIIIDKFVIHASLNGKITAYNLLDGSHSWQFEYDDQIVNNLAMIDNNLIAASQNGKISNYNPKTGELNWSLQINDAIYASPVLNSQYVYISTYTGSIIQIGMKSGEIKNRFESDVEVYLTPALDDNNLYIVLSDGRLIALGQSNLKVKWKKQLDSPFSSSPLVGSNELITGIESKKLHRINKFTGEVIQTIKLEGRPRTQPIYYNNKIYLSYEPDMLAVFSTNGASDD